MYLEVAIFAVCNQHLTSYYLEGIYVAAQKPTVSLIEEENFS